MELDLIEQKRPRFSRRKPTGQPPDASACGKKCYGCGKLGHIIKNCCSKNKVRREKINMMKIKEWKQYLKKNSTETNPVIQKTYSKVSNETFTTDWQTMDTPKFSEDKRSNSEELRKQQQIINNIKRNLDSDSNNKQDLLQAITTKETKMQLKLLKKERKLPPLTRI